MKLISRLQNIVKNKKFWFFSGIGIVLLLVLTNFLQPSSTRYSDTVSLDFAGGNYESMELVSRSNSVSQKGMAAPAVSEVEYDAEVSRQIIKNGSLNLVVKDLAMARDQIVSIVESKEGFISSSNFNQRYDSGQKQVFSNGKSGSLIIRVPSKSFESLMTEVKQVALVVTSDNSNSSDVTERYLDLELRLKNKLAEENQYRVILQKAEEVSDILEVTRYIEQARGEAERLEGQLRVLSNQIELSTIHIYLESEKQYEIAGITWSPIDTIKSSYQSLLSGVTTLIDRVISLLIISPLILVYGVMAWFGFSLLRRVYKKYIV